MLKCKHLCPRYLKLHEMVLFTVTYNVYSIIQQKIILPLTHSLQPQKEGNENYGHGKHFGLFLAITMLIFLAIKVNRFYDFTHSCIIQYSR